MRIKFHEIFSLPTHHRCVVLCGGVVGFGGTDARKLTSVSCDMPRKFRKCTVQSNAPQLDANYGYFAQNRRLVFPNRLVSVMKLKLVIKIALTKAFMRHIIICG